ncbi:unnamed protein product [Ambrosiozyma monospora]|uniref:Unnamed protein product n=1 Tax=Ambrosiozyma monospora TaxID=43982 RepID=A0ACB5TWW7_AMBMO|nr:unnamed protein product [Ambrosiozyma monospora]
MLSELNLNHNHLGGQLSEDISYMKNLTHLSVFKNQLISLPDSIGRLKKLNYLDVHLNNMSELTREIWHLDSLETLNVSSNNLSFFPDEPTTASTAYAPNSQDTPESQKLPPVSPIERLPVPFSAPIATSATSANFNSGMLPQPVPPPPAILERLSVPPTNPGDEEYDMMLIETNSANSLSLRDTNNKTPVTKSMPVDMPIAEGIGKSLKVLSMNDNHLNDSVIERISIFKNLEVLNLSYNELYDIPYGQMSQLTNLKSLYLSGNHLSSLPVDDLDSFKQLTTLHLNGNKFHSLPPEFAKLTSMTSLDVGSNELRYNIGNVPYDWNCHSIDEMTLMSNWIRFCF